MDIDYDPDKRLQTLEHRGLDMNDAPLLFDGLKVTIHDDRKTMASPVGLHSVIYGTAWCLLFGRYMEARRALLV